MTGPASQARATPKPASSARIPPGAYAPGPYAPGGRLPAQLEAMRRGGMSATAIRRALGLSFEQALAAGVIAPPRRRRAQTDEAPAPGARAAPAPVPVPDRRGRAMEAVVAAVAAAAGLGTERLRGPRQDRALVRPRHLAMLLVRERCAGASLPAIGQLLGRDHSTVLYGCRRAAALLARDSDYRGLRDRALEILNHRPAAAGP